MSIKVVLAILLLGLSTMVAPAQSRRDLYDTKILKGLPGVMVATDEVMTLACKDSPETESLSRTQARTYIEQLLQKGGIKVFPEVKDSENTSTPRLHLSLISFKDRYEAYNYSLRLELEEEVMMPRKPHNKIKATVWRDSLTGNGAGDKILQHKICTLVAYFVWSYQDANNIGITRQPKYFRIDDVGDELCGIIH